MSGSFTGRQHTEESKRKIRLAILKKRVPPDVYALLAENPQLKWCPACSRALDVERFTTAPSKGDGHWQYCRECNKNKQREFARTPVGRAGQRRRMIKHRYGLSDSEYQELVRLQPGCAICSKTFSESVRPQVDHCHVTGKVGGLLCDSCNAGLGMFRDDTALLRAAIEYVRANR